jgi:predicted N-acetyltransferase YhbS
MFLSGAAGNLNTITGRELLREEVKRVWDIDRSEVIENIYYLENGKLVLKPETYHMTGWPPGEAELYTTILLDCFDRGGWFYGLFDEVKLVGVTILENKFIGKNKNLLQLKFLHVSSAYRKQGLGHRLFELSKVKAQEKGAKGLYISATPSENTINFYLHLGCVRTQHPDPELFALEPEDIHLECTI